jgi:tetratricopeptide (TPR) repeat protein
MGHTISVSMRMAWVRTATVLSLVFLSSYGYAGQQETAAREQVKQATTAYNLGHFDEAAQHYEEAYRLVQDPILLFDIGQSYRLGEKPEKAITAYRSYLRTAGSDAPNRAVVEKHLAELKRQLDESKASAPEPTAASTVAPIAPPAAAPGAASVMPAASVSPPALATSPASADDSATAKATPGAESSSTPFYKTWWFWTGVGAAVVAGTVTAFAVSRGEQNACSGNALTCVGIK